MSWANQDVKIDAYSFGKCGLLLITSLVWDKLVQEQNMAMGPIKYHPLERVVCRSTHLVFTKHSQHIFFCEIAITTSEHIFFGCTEWRFRHHHQWMVAYTTHEVWKGEIFLQFPTKHGFSPQVVCSSYIPEYILRESEWKNAIYFSKYFIKIPRKAVYAVGIYLYVHKKIACTHMLKDDSKWLVSKSVMK